MLIVPDVLALILVFILGPILVLILTLILALIIALIFAYIYSFRCRIYMSSCDGFGHEKITTNVANMKISFIVLCFDILVCVSFGLVEITTNVANKYINSIVLCFGMLACISVSVVQNMPPLSSQIRLVELTKAVSVSQLLFLL